MHRIFHRLPLQLRALEQSTLLVVAPHMDDDAIGLGGTLALHQELGSELHVAFCAAGATPEADRVRRAEARHAAELLGYRSVDFLGFREGHLSPSEADLARALADLLRKLAPRQVFCPFFTDHHRDHTAAAMALAEALRETRLTPEVWAYEIWSPLWPNTAVDITRAVERKRTAIDAYASQVADVHYTDGTLGLNRYRGIRAYVPYAEVFYVATAKDFVELSRAMNQP